MICWALVAALPVMIALCWLRAPQSRPDSAEPAWLGLAHVSVFSMLTGFFLWYRGLALGGIAAVGPLQLLQPFFGLPLAAVLLAGPADALMTGVTEGMGACVAAAKRFAP